MQYLRYNTDSQEVVFGIFVDSTDGNTEETGLTIANTDIKIWKAGATTLANKNSGGATHISNGIYYAVFDSTDTNTLGSGKAYVHVSGALYQVLEFCVLPQKVYDSMIAGSDNLEVDTIQIEGTDATDQINSACDTAISDAGVTTTRMGYLDAAISSRSSLTAQQVWEYTTRTLSAFGFNVTVDTNNDKTGYTLSASGVSAVQSGLSTLTAQQVWEYATRTLSAFGFIVTVGTNNDKTGYSLSATPPTAAAIADAVWDEAISGHTGAGTTGAALSASGGSSLTAAAIADAVLDEALSGHTTSGTTGAALSAASSAGDPWSTLLPGSYAEGTAGYIIGNLISSMWGYTTGVASFLNQIVVAVWSYVTRTITGAAAGTTIPGYPTITAGDITLGDIYANAAALVYGDITAAPPPVHEVASLQSMILMRHRDCQLGFNYWFQQVQAIINIITGTTEYLWPANFKEYISLADVNFVVTAAGFRLTETPTIDTTTTLKYWAILPAPGTWDAAYSDSITNYLTWYVTYAAVADMYLKRSETTEAQAFYQLADTARLNAEREDFHRRQSLGVIF